MRPTKQVEGVAGALALGDTEAVIKFMTQSRRYGQATAAAAAAAAVATTVAAHTERGVDLGVSMV